MYITWNGRGIKIDGEYISHLQFEGDIVIVAKSLQELQGTLSGLNEASQRLTHTSFPAPSPLRVYILKLSLNMSTSSRSFSWARQHLESYVISSRYLYHKV
ncbi:unnamed protein product [Euphydryas editha]|uniref:Uncharacterized protein n=1 Tax=Euphydryas editha TaxID=104508 RepID=A0AAU9U9Q7_EUPED|nr:unnamed protein product [Euphydryas editha]